MGFAETYHGRGGTFTLLDPHLFSFMWKQAIEEGDACDAMMGKLHAPLPQLVSLEKARHFGARLQKLCSLCLGWPPKDHQCLVEPVHGICDFYSLNGQL